MRTHLRWLAAALLLAVLFDLVFYNGFFGSDDAYYTWAAHQLANRTNFLAQQPFDNHAAVTRIAFNLPLGFVYWLSNGSTTWMCLFQILYHLGCVVIAFVLGRQVSGDFAGRAASLIVATCPLLYLFAGSMLPDVALAMWSGLYLLLLCYAIRRAPDGSWRRNSLRFVIAGVCLGLAYSVKPTALILAVPTAIAIIVALPSIRRPAWIAHGAAVIVGLGVVLVLEWFVLKVFRGEWIAGLNVQHYTGGGAEGDFLIYAQKQGLDLTTRLHSAIRELRVNAPFTLPVLAAGVIGHTISPRRAGPLVVFAWFTPLYLAFGTVAIGSYVFMPMFPRYFTPIVIPSAVATGCAIAYGWETFARRVSRPVVRRGTAITLAVIACLVVACETRVNLRLDNSIARAIWVRSFERAYQTATVEYPEYPIVLPDRVATMVVPMLEPDIAERVYYKASTPWGDDQKRTPSPPFLLLTTTKYDPPLLALWSLGDVDLEHVEIEPLAIVPAETAQGVERLRAAAQVLVGTEPLPRATDTLSGWDATTIYLVKPAAETRVRMAIPITVLAPGVSSATTITGSALSWSSKVGFAADYFEGGSPYYMPSTRMAEVPSGTHEIRVSLGTRSFRGTGIHGIAEVWAYDADNNVVEWTERKVGLSGGEHLVNLTVSSDRELHAYRVRWWIEAPASGALHLDLIDSTTAPATSRWIDLAVLTDGPIDVERSGDNNTVAWGAGAQRFAVQAFDSRNYRYPSFDSKAQLASGRLVGAFAVATSIHLVAGPEVEVDVEVFAYADDGALVGMSAQHVTVRTIPTPLEITLTPSQPAKTYRVRWWFDPRGPGSVELGSPTVTIR